MSKSKRKKQVKTSEKLNKQLAATTAKNIANIEARERGEKTKDATDGDRVSVSAYYAKRDAKPLPKTDKGMKSKVDHTALAGVLPAPKSAAAKDTKSQDTKPTKPAKKGGAKLSALDAAAKVLVESKQSMTSQQIVDAMAAKNLWRSPGGKTPAATVYAAMTREIGKLGKDSRFRKFARGVFVAGKVG